MTGYKRRTLAHDGVLLLMFGVFLAQGCAGRIKIVS